jgi:hypothetical protein
MDMVVGGLNLVFLIEKIPKIQVPIRDLEMTSYLSKPSPLVARTKFHFISFHFATCFKQIKSVFFFFLGDYFGAHNNTNNTFSCLKQVVKWGFFFSTSEWVWSHKLKPQLMLGFLHVLFCVFCSFSVNFCGLKSFASTLNWHLTCTF